MLMMVNFSSPFVHLTDSFITHQGNTHVLSMICL